MQKLLFRAGDCAPEGTGASSAEAAAEAAWESPAVAAAVGDMSPLSASAPPTLPLLLLPAATPLSTRDRVACSSSSCQLDCGWHMWSAQHLLSTVISHPILP